MSSETGVTVSRLCGRCACIVPGNNNLTMRLPARSHCPELGQFAIGLWQQTVSLPRCALHGPQQLPVAAHNGPDNGTNKDLSFQ